MTSSIARRTQQSGLKYTCAGSDAGFCLRPGAMRAYGRTYGLGPSCQRSVSFLLHAPPYIPVLRPIKRFNPAVGVGRTAPTGRFQSRSRTAQPRPDRLCCCSVQLETVQRAPPGSKHHVVAAQTHRGARTGRRFLPDSFFCSSGATSSTDPPSWSATRRSRSASTTLPRMRSINITSCSGGIQRGSTAIPHS
jgi:hypothetical protein